MIVHKLSSYFDTGYVGKFLLRLLGFYLLFRLVNWGMVGMITKEGYYNSFADHYLDYVTPLRASIMYGGKLLAEVFGIKTQLLNDFNLKVENGGLLRMAWACVGLEIMSFWAAFALADTTSLRTKLHWVFTGLLSIWLINCLRVALLLAAKQNRWQELLILDQHDLFNYFAYLLVLLLMYIYYRGNKKEADKAKQAN